MQKPFYQNLNKRKAFIPQQIAEILKELEEGKNATDISRQHDSPRKQYSLVTAGTLKPSKVE